MEYNIISFLKSKKEQLDSNDPVALTPCQEFIDKVTVNNDKTDVEFKITVVFNGGGGGNRTHRPEDKNRKLLRGQPVFLLSPDWCLPAGHNRAIP